MLNINRKEEKQICRFNNDGLTFLYHVCLVCERHLYRPTECSDIDKEHEVRNGGDATSVLVI